MLTVNCLVKQGFSRWSLYDLIKYSSVLDSFQGIPWACYGEPSNREYFQKKDHEDGSALLQARYATSEKHKIPLEDIARYEVGGALAILVNTSPALFSMLFYVFSHPKVLEDCRREIDTIMTIQTRQDKSVLRSFDITNAKNKCPVLASTYQEVLRLTSLGTSVRQVMQDTLLDDITSQEKEDSLNANHRRPQR